MVADAVVEGVGPHAGGCPPLDTPDDHRSARLSRQNSSKLLALGLGVIDDDGME